MTVYNNASDWAADQKVGPPAAKLLLMLIAFDVDKGEPGATFTHVSQRSGMTMTEAFEQIEALQDRDLVEVVAKNPLRLAPRWLS